MISKILLFFFLICTSFSVGAWGPRPIMIERPDAGIGAWQDMPFGQMRLLSCTTGVKDLPMVVGGLQVKLDPDWVMKKPTLKPLSNQPSWIEAPVAAGNGENPQYKGEVLFPLIYHRPSDKTEDFELGVQGDLPVCQGQKCMTLPIRIGLLLTADEADYTSACPYLIDRQRQVPLPANALGVQGVAWRQGNEIQMAFLGIKKANVAFLQTTTDAPFQVYETQMEKEGVLMRLKTHPWALGAFQEWILITDQGVLKVPVLMQQTAVILPPAPVASGIWILGWELFFLTPLFIWWGLGCAKTNKKWKKEIVSLMLWLPVILILKGIITFLFPLDFPYYAVLILGGVCLFPPVKKEGALLLFLMWPYFPEIPEMKMNLYMLWFGVLLIEVMIPFIFLYIKADEIAPVLRTLKKKHFFTYNLIFLIPTLFLLGGFGKQIFQNDSVFFNELNPKGLSVVCSSKEQRSWKNEARLIAPKSVLGSSLQEIYQRQRVILWQDENGRLVLAPDISKKKVWEAISNWQKYHAASKP